MALLQKKKGSGEKEEAKEYAPTKEMKESEGEEEQGNCLYSFVSEFLESDTTYSVRVKAKL